MKNKDLSNSVFNNTISGISKYLSRLGKTLVSSFDYLPLKPFIAYDV